MKEREWLLFFQQLNGIGSITMKKIYDYFGSFSSAALAKHEQFRNVGLSSRVIDEIVSKVDGGLDGIESFTLECRKREIHILTVLDDDYPTLLKELYDPPWALFVKGNRHILNEHSISVVGTREPSFYGKYVCNELGKTLALHEIPVISGLAKGIDRYIHEAVLRQKGKCVAVIASGFDNIYPSEHKTLAANIIENDGCLVSEYAYWIKAKPGQFPARNRIISGLSLATVVVESKEKGGALITADQALEQNREVFAVPGNINSPNSVGTNYLIKQGAKMLTRWDDIFDEIQEFQKKNCNDSINIQQTIDISKEEQELLTLIPFQEIHIDDLQMLYHQPNLFVLLIQLQLKQKIESLPGHYYIRI
ncbi:DNA-processing protein DprA [Desulfuribacillus stibiiarsenatis]|uniref:DNA-processing protein DprA n=1 Tax=Desulfuribacillus stibiiarsenatis TaxID=1390249 RepID=UPI000A531D48|nr:DNA-processing protein DprA [Desulfuribacillus stibiiarsenatis]